jgi:hypothetical protein
MKLTNVEASIAHNPKAPLLLGQTAIERLGKIQLDLANNTLTILNPNFKGSYDYSPNTHCAACFDGKYPTELFDSLTV